MVKGLITACVFVTGTRFSEQPFLHHVKGRITACGFVTSLLHPADFHLMRCSERPDYRLRFCMLAQSDTKRLPLGGAVTRQGD